MMVVVSMKYSLLFGTPQKNRGELGNEYLRDFKNALQASEARTQINSHIRASHLDGN
jgi:hypothetical protein